MVLAALVQSDWPTQLPDDGRGWRITFTLYQHGGRLMDSDAVVGCYKRTRDVIAKFLGCDDGPDGPEWIYRGPLRGPDETRLVLERTT